LHKSQRVFEVLVYFKLDVKLLSQEQIVSFFSAGTSTHVLSLAFPPSTNVSTFFTSKARSF